MKKKIVFLFAMLMLVLAGCGPKINDHVVDYKVDLPENFVEGEQEGVDAYWYDPSDGSNFNVSITKKAATADVAFKAVTADILRETVMDAMKDSYNETPSISDRFFTKEDVCGLPAYQYGYDMTLEGINITQIIVGVNADKTYAFTFTTNNDETLKTLEQRAKNIQLTIE